MTLSANDFELLLQANRILSSKLNVDEVLEAVLELATKVVRADASSLLLLDEKNNELYFDVALGSVKDQVKEIRIKVGEGIAGWVAKEMKPLIVNDVGKDPRFTQRVDKSTSFKTKSILAVPLRAKGRLIGVVEAINKENEQQFTLQDQEAFGVFASQAGIAIENARLFSAISAEKKKLSTAFSQMSDGVLVLNEKGNVLLLNKAACDLLGTTEEAAMGRTFDLSLFPGFESDAPLDYLINTHKNHFELELSRSQGKDCFLQLFVYRVLNERSNDAESWMVFLRDVTETKKGERLKSDFLSLMSHKLKTPLTVILGYAPVLAQKNDGLSDFQIKAIDSIVNQGEQLSDLVEKLLRFTIVESEKVKKPEKPIDPLSVINDVVKKYQEENESVKIDMGGKKSTPKKKDDQILMDGPLLAEVVKNLIENGIKFNDKKNKQIQILIEKDEKHWILNIKDNGLGIPAEEREKIFKKFYQIENSFTGQVPGAGLGLAFCKKVIEESGGSISVKSELNIGTTFSIYLPIQ